MVKQTIAYSDGSEKVINYRGVIKDGVLQSEEETGENIPAPEPVEEAVEAPVEETPVSEKVAASEESLD